MKTIFRKYYNPKTLVLLLPILLFIVFRFIIGFNGLYGQDSHEYYRYSRAILDFLKTGNSAGDYFWPIYYPILGAILGMVIDNLISLQLISFLSLSGSLFFLFKILDKIFNDKHRSLIYLLITFLLSPYVFRNSTFVMTDLLTVFFILASFYFFIDYLDKVELKQILLFSVFTTMAVLTRYSAAVVLTIPSLVIIYHIIKKRKLPHLVIAVIIAMILTTPHILTRESKITEFLGHVWLQEWSVLNYLKRDFITLEGTYHYRFPNILNSLSNIFYPTYLVFGIILISLLKKNLFKNRLWLITLIIVLLYALLIAGIPYQNQRYLLLSYPFVAILLFPGFKRLVATLHKSKILFYSAIFLMLILQIFFCTYFFRSAYERNILEKEIAVYVKNDIHKYIYAFDIDVSFMSYDVNKNVINMWKEKIYHFNHNSLVIFNEDKFKVQWAKMNPMLNWNELKSNYTLLELKDFGNGWKVYEIR
jgi:hypothetical protein